MNLTKRYKEKLSTYPVNIKDVTIGMKVRIGERIDTCIGGAIKSRSGMKGTVISTDKCNTCNGSRHKDCGLHIIGVKIDNSKETMITYSCYYKLLTIHGAPIVSEGKYLYGCDRGPIQ